MPRPGGPGDPAEGAPGPPAAGPRVHIAPVFAKPFLFAPRRRPLFSAKRLKSSQIRGRFGPSLGAAFAEPRIGISVSLHRVRPRKARFRRLRIRVLATPGGRSTGPLPSLEARRVRTARPREEWTSPPVSPDAASSAARPARTPRLARPKPPTPLPPAGLARAAKPKGIPRLLGLGPLLLFPPSCLSRVLSLAAERLLLCPEPPGFFSTRSRASSGKFSEDLVDARDRLHLYPWRPQT